MHSLVHSLLLPFAIGMMEVMAVPAAVYSLVMFATAGLATWWLRRAAKSRSFAKAT